MTEQELPKDVNKEQIQHLRRLSATIEDIYTYRESKRIELESCINDFIATQHPQSHEDRAQIAHIINSSLACAGYAIDFQGERCYLNVTSGKKDPKGRFRITPLGSCGHIASPADLCAIAPLHLTHAVAAQSAIMSQSLSSKPRRWTERVSNDASGQDIMKH